MTPETNDIKEIKLFEVRRYFDDHFEAVVEKNLTEHQANNVANRLNKIPRAYVQYLVREQQNK